jgi:hypothetical protein
MLLWFRRSPSYPLLSSPHLAWELAPGHDAGGFIGPILHLVTLIDFTVGLSNQLLQGMLITPGKSIDIKQYKST